MCTIIPCVLYVWVRSYKGLIPPLFLTLSEVLFLLSLEQSVHARFTILCSSWNVVSMGWSLYLLACTFLKRYLGKGASWEFHIHDSLPSLFQFSVSSWENDFTYACPSLGYGLGQNFLWGKKFHSQLLIAIGVLCLARPSLCIIYVQRVIALDCNICWQKKLNFQISKLIIC